jgi:hypothetical protein
MRLISNLQLSFKDKEQLKLFVCFFSSDNPSKNWKILLRLNYRLSQQKKEISTAQHIKNAPQIVFKKNAATLA